jgi:hypothetical protein
MIGWVLFLWIDLFLKAIATVRIRNRQEYVNVWKGGTFGDDEAEEIISELIQENFVNENASLWRCLPGSKFRVKLGT